MSIDNYIMSDEINNIEDDINKKFNHRHITLNNMVYMIDLKYYGNFIISDSNSLKYYGKFIIFNELGNKHINRHTRLKIIRKYIKRMQRYNNLYHISVNYTNNMHDFTIVCKERLKCQ